MSGFCSEGQELLTSSSARPHQVLKGGGLPRVRTGGRGARAGGGPDSASHGLSRPCCHLCPQDPNQLIRASALRVLSSIRVPIIVPIMMLAIKEAASDMSPYVRENGRARHP